MPGVQVFPLLTPSPITTLGILGGPLIQSSLFLSSLAYPDPRDLWVKPPPPPANPLGYLSSLVYHDPQGL